MAGGLKAMSETLQHYLRLVEAEGNFELTCQLTGGGAAVAIRRDASVEEVVGKLRELATLLERRARAGSRTTVRMLSLIHELWQIAAPVGAQHAYWDTIIDMQAFTRGERTLVQKTALEWIEHAERLLAEHADRSP